MSDAIAQLKYQQVIANTRNIQTQPITQKNTETASDFEAILKHRIQQNSDIAFSKHAIARVQERQIDLGDNMLERLNQGVALASAKGLQQSLILVDQTAFVVNVPNNKVITTMSDDALKGNVFTNIDGTVII
ncbi:MAG: TIGR02530 family flagellar biosynthesis protein [Erysipelotrichaceae bacterium]